MAESSGRSKTIITHPQAIRENPNGAVKGRETRKTKAALEEKGTVLLRQPLPKYNYQKQTRKPNSIADTKYVQPVANVEPSPRGNSFENGGKIVYKVSPLKAGDVDTSGKGGDEKQAISVRETQTLVPMLNDDAEGTRKISGQSELEEVKRLREENVALKNELDTKVTSLTKQLDVQLQVKKSLDFVESRLKCSFIVVNIAGMYRNVFTSNKSFGQHVHNKRTCE